MNRPPGPKVPVVESIESCQLVEVRLFTLCRFCFSFFLFTNLFPILKILVIFSDGNTVDKNGDIMESFMLEKPAKVLRVDNNIKIAGVLIPNTENAPRIQELKGITSEPDDAINAAFSAKLDEIADLLVKKVKEVLCPYGKNLSYLRKNLTDFFTSFFFIWLCLTRTGNYRIHEFDWLKSLWKVF